MVSVDVVRPNKTISLKEVIRIFVFTGKKEVGFVGSHRYLGLGCIGLRLFLPDAEFGRNSIEELFLIHKLEPTLFEGGFEVRFVFFAG